MTGGKLMSDKRNNDLESIIAHIFPMKCNTVYAEKKQVIIGDGKYANKCSFRETDKEYYINLFKYTFAIDGTEFIDKERNRYVGFNRLTAVDNAIKYLNKIGIIINCTLYCDSEKTLLARYIFQIFEKILSVMFSFGKNFDEEKYTKLFNETTKYYYREIVTKGIISLIYTNAGWSDVELNKKNEDGNDCLLIDNGVDWRKYYGICHVDTGLKLQIKSNMDAFFHSGITYQCDKLFNLQNKPVPIREDAFCYLDFFHLDHDYYVPNRFCYCTNLKHITTEEKFELERTIVHDTQYSLASEYVTHVPKYGSEEFEQALIYLRQTYCTNKKQQYMNTFSIIAEIISALLRINYNYFYSDNYDLSNTVFGVGFKQLIYFFEDNKIEYQKKEINAIYKYLITTWLDSYCQYLDQYNFEEMYSMYSNKNEDKEYVNSIDASRRKINLYTTLNVFDGAYNSYTAFYNRNSEAIKSFESIIPVEKNESFEQIIIRKCKIEFNPFNKLKKSIKEFQEKIEWIVPYHVRITVVEGENMYVGEDVFKGHVGDRIPIEFPCDDKYIVEGPDFITLRFNYNIAEIKYKLKAEYISEQTNKTLLQNTMENVDGGLILKKNHKYNIEFEAYGTSNAPFSFIIIRRNMNQSIDTVFDKNDITLSADYKKYSFQFTYNGETGDSCYLAFGYGNTMYEYGVQNIKLSEIE